MNASTVRRAKRTAPGVGRLDRRSVYSGCLLESLSMMEVGVSSVVVHYQRQGNSKGRSLDAYIATVDKFSRNQGPRTTLEV